MEKINPKNLQELFPLKSQGKVRSKDSSFGDQLKQSILAVNDRQHSADQAIEKVIKGQMGIHEGMLSIQEADISLRLLLKVRRKVMDAYTEIMRMQL